MEDAGCQASLPVSGSRQGGFQLITDGEEFFDLGDDAVLFGEGGYYKANIGQSKAIFDSSLRCSKLHLTYW